MCLASGNADTAANRLYYALFQAVKCYGLKTDEMTLNGSNTGSDHRQAGELIANRSGGLAMRRTFARLKGIRETADYALESVVPAELIDLQGHANDIRQHFLKLAQERVT